MNIPNNYIRKGDGLSQKERIERVTSPEFPEILDCSIDSLLEKVKTAASCIHYYNFNNEPEGFYLPLIRDLISGDEPVYDGNMEPSRALLYTFIRQLHTLSRQFNDQWKNFFYWYMEDVLAIEPQKPLPDHVWVTFLKNVPGTIPIKKETCFISSENSGNPFCYRLENDFEIQDIEISEIISLSFQKEQLYPAAQLDCITSLEMKDLLRDEISGEWMFETEKKPEQEQTPGFMITSPALLLREGKRLVTITFETETSPLTHLLQKIRTGNVPELAALSEKALTEQLLNNIFYLEISTTTGWSTIPNVTIRNSEECKDDLIIRFSLSEKFPAVTSCTTDLHGNEYEWPALKVYLNYDAWLYPYSWLKDFRLRRILIRTFAENITNLLIYNELGQIDNSKPFVPFGVNTQRGTWFAFGNYEMAIKHTQWIDLTIQWGQLADDPHGLKGYYKEYASGIENGSFRILPRYLSDYAWKETVNSTRYPLFSTSPLQPDGNPVPDAPLAPETRWYNIAIEEMEPVDTEEENYDYNIRSRNGFISCMLDAPVIGFGEKRYRQLFTGQLMKNMLKKKAPEILNPPLSPVIERITLNYQAEECIDLRKREYSGRNAFYHLYPLGIRKVFPRMGNKTIPLIWSINTDASLVIGIRNNRNDHFIRLFFRFVTLSREIEDETIPVLSWYYGDGYNWRPMPDDTIINDTTCHLMKDGNVDFCLPEEVENYRDETTGTLWIRAGISGNLKKIAALEAIYTNAAKLTLVIERTDDEKWESFKSKERELIPETNIPGITGIELITSFMEGRETENKLQKLVRISEYISHRGRAVTPRDYERITLQLFPSIGKVKCLPGYDPGKNRPGVVTLVVIPEKSPVAGNDWLPQVSSVLLQEIEKRITPCASPAVRKVRVMNPACDKVIIRCRVSFKQNFPASICRRRLQELCDFLIAPWQTGRELPRFNHSINKEQILETIRKQEYIRDARELTIIRLDETQEKNYQLQEYIQPDDQVYPSTPHSILIPAAEHIFIYEEDSTFGINEMIIDDTFVI